MNLEYLKENRDKILQEFSEELCHDDARHVRYEIDWLLLKADNNEWSSLEDACEERLSEKAYSYASRKSKKYYFRCICRKLFPDCGLLSRERRCCEDPIDALRQSRRYLSLNREYQGLLDAYIVIAEKAGKKRETIYTHCSLSSVFLRYLQKNGIDSLAAAAEQTIMSFFYADAQYEQQIRSYSFKEKLVVVIKACMAVEKYSEGCKHVLNMIPSFRYVRKNVEYLTKSEAEALRNSLDSEEFSLRDRAIIMMLLYTGMRSCDVAAVRLADIDWAGETIHIVQQKTDEPLAIAMMPAVGNAIFEYLRSEAASHNSAYLFSETGNREKHITAKSVRNIAEKAYRIAGIRQNKGDRKGTHLFRHYAATRMLENGTQRPVISRALGHADPESIMPYLHTDFRHLGELALSLEDYPISEEVWNV